MLNNSDSTESGNFQYTGSLSKKHRAILNEVENSQSPITPKEISLKTQINLSTVRKYLRDIEKQALAMRVSHGYYISTKTLVTFPSSMVADVSPRVHCLRLRFTDVDKHPISWRKDYGVAKVSFQVHGNKTATVFIDCNGDTSFDYVGFRLLVALVLMELGCSGADFSNITVSSFELNNDFRSIRLDGVKAVTLKALDGGFRRAYNKSFGLRIEAATAGSPKVETVLALLQGGVAEYNLLRLLTSNLHLIQKYFDATRFQNRLISDAVGQMRRLVEAFLEGRSEATI